jgi:hypothetical protein
MNAGATPAVGQAAPAGVGMRMAGAGKRVGAGRCELIVRHFDVLASAG